MSLPSAVPQHGPFGLSVTVPARSPRSELVDRLRTTLADLGPVDGPTQVWVEQAADADNTLLAELGFTPYRDLHQLRRPLPAAPSGLDTRSFRSPQDIDDFIRVNARAFQWHPEQGHMTADDLRSAMTEPWFDAEGFRLLERDGTLAGFCWTKVHPATDHDPVLGEIYAIAVDPDFHGQGLGAPMTLAGLEHLSALGIAHANLYVEADNAAALRVYARLGFELHSINRAYRNGPDPTDETEAS